MYESNYGNDGNLISSERFLPCVSLLVCAHVLAYVLLIFQSFIKM